MRLCRFRADSDSLRQQLLKWLLIPMVILLLLNIALVYKFGHDSANRRHDRFLLDASKILLDQLYANAGRVEFDIHSGALNVLNRDKADQVYYSISDPGRKYQFGSPDLPAPPEKPGATPLYYLANYAGHPVRMMAAVLPDSGVPGGQVVVMVAKTLALYHERSQEWVWRVLPTQFLLVVFMGIMVWWGVGRGLRPLVQMRDEVASRSSQDLRPLEEHKVVAEVRPLIRGFNNLLGRLEESLAQQKRFIADAAHQLHTPIAGLKAQAELALQLDDPAETRHSLQQMHTATVQTAHLVRQLLALSRAEPEAQKHDFASQLDWVALVKQTTTHWVQTALQKNIDLGFEASDATFAMPGNEFLLVEMLNNVIDNAMRYTPDNGRVTVRIMRGSDRLVVEVEDNGAGIPEDQRERVFERFYRVLGSNQTGCGLGLAIVREIAARHGGEVVIQKGAGGIGTLVKLGFPIRKREATA
ncbi:MAG: sensor histidine kinase [Gallionella sp.]|uniref:histidine kinase n=1 Tax=mine drainage metagenome TaxID=410659 RepID=E6QNK0_9ZZZZ|nr:sensor histidine kinase [Gallionella sp.]